MSNYKKITLLIISILIVFGSFYLYMRYDYRGEISKIEKEIKKEEELLSLVNSQLAEMNIDEQKKEANNLYKQLPSSDGIPQLFEFLHQASTKNNSTIRDITFDEELDATADTVDNDVENEKKYKITTFNLRVESNSYESIRLFIQDLYDYERLVNIGGLKLEDKNGVIEAELTLAIYFAPYIDGYIPDLEPVKTYSPANKINPTK